MDCVQVVSSPKINTPFVLRTTTPSQINELLFLDFPLLSVLVVVRISLGSFPFLFWCKNHGRRRFTIDGSDNPGLQLLLFVLVVNLPHLCALPVWHLVHGEGARYQVDAFFCYRNSSQSTLHIQILPLHVPSAPFTSSSSISERPIWSAQSA